MASKQLFTGLVAVCLISACAGLAPPSPKEKLQEAANNITETVAKVRESTDPEILTRLEQVIFLVNTVAGVWYQIDEWGSQQSRWDLMIETADNAVGEVLKLMPYLPETAKQPCDWCSKAPYADMESVAMTVCEQMISMESYAQETYDVDLDLTSMSNCYEATELAVFSAMPEEDVVFISASAPAPAPGPAPSRRLLRA